MLVSERVRVYFQSWATQLTSEGRKALIYPNKGDAGGAREDALAKFIRTHLPIRCRISKGGFIFDYKGRESKQLDLIITNDLALQFEDESLGKSFAQIEGSYCAISVKTHLDKAQLIDSLDNLASIPPMPQQNINIDSNISKINRALFFDLPFGIIFAYDGNSSENILEHIFEYYKNSIIEDHRRPRMIIVNDKYLLWKVSPYLVDNTDEIPLSGYRLITHEPIGAYSLLCLMCSIQGAASYGGSFRFSSGPYLNLLVGNLISDADEDGA